MQCCIYHDDHIEFPCEAALQILKRCSQVGPQQHLGKTGCRSRLLIKLGKKGFGASTKLPLQHLQIRQTSSLLKPLQREKQRFTEGLQRADGGCHTWYVCSSAHLVNVLKWPRLDLVLWDLQHPVQ